MRIPFSYTYFKVHVWRETAQTLTKAKRPANPRVKPQRSVKVTGENAIRKKKNMKSLTATIMGVFAALFMLASTVEAGTVTVHWNGFQATTAGPVVEVTADGVVTSFPTTTGTTVINTLDVDDTTYFIDLASNGGGALGSFKVDGSGLAKEASANYTIEDGGATVKLRTYAMTTWQLFDGVLLDQTVMTGVLGQGHKFGNPQYIIVPAGSRVDFDGYFWPPSVRYDPYFMIDLDGVPSTTVLTNPDGRMSVGIHVAGGGGGAGADGTNGTDGTDGADGGQGDQGKQGDAGADAPCIECVDLSPILVEFACKILAANPPTTQQAFDDCVAAILNAMTATTDICGGDTAGCLASITADIEAAK